MDILDLIDQIMEIVQVQMEDQDTQVLMGDQLDTQVLMEDQDTQELMGDQLDTQVLMEDQLDTLVLELTQDMVELLDLSAKNQKIPLETKETVL